MIMFSYLGKLHIDPGMVLGYLSVLFYPFQDRVPRRLRAHPLIILNIIHISKLYQLPFNNKISLLTEKAVNCFFSCYFFAVALMEIIDLVFICVYFVIIKT